MSACTRCKLPLERFQTFKELNGDVLCEMCVAKLVAYDNGEKAAEARIVAWLQGIVDGTYDDPVSPSDIIYMIEEGEHREGK